MNAGAVRFALWGLVRSPGRTLLRVAVLAMAVALMAAMLVFVDRSLSTMTATAARSAPLDWQGPVPSYRQATGVAAAVAREQGVAAAFGAATAPFAGTSHNSPAGLVRSSSGAILAVPPAYASHLNTMRFLRGGLRPGQVVLDQQLAATLQAGVGDTISVTPTAHARPQQFTVSGIALVTAPDVLFQPLNPLLGPAPAQPPAEIMVMPVDTFATRLAASYASGPSPAAGLPGTPAGVQWQVQAQLDPTALTGSPSHAATQETQIRNRVERDLTGKVQFVDNLGDTLTSAAGDALYAETLYIMLAVPGAMIALGLAYLAALGTLDRDRRDLALLRSRGAGRRGVIAVALVESVAVALPAGVIGAALGWAALHWRVSGVHPSVAYGAVVVAVCVLLALLGAAAARLGAAAAVLRGPVVESGRAAGPQGRPLWQRLWLDVAALVLSGAIYWLTVSTGFSAVVNPDSNPTLSLSIYMFFAPALLWIGAALLLVRLRGRVLAWAVSRAGGRRPTTRRGLLLASAGRRGAAVNRGLFVVGLLLAFGVNLGLFTATYDQQAAVDAQLTLGADVVVTAPSGAAGPSLARAVSSVPGVKATTPVDHSYAYVGPDLQDTFGIDAAGLTRATSLRDSYFVGSSAAQAMAALRARPDGILVSRETITDYQLNVGDLLRLRVLDQRTGRFRVAPFHVVGVVQEFPSAPKDSFMVTNLAYLEQVTHGAGPNVLFARAGGDPAAVAARVAGVAGPHGATVRNIRQQARVTTSSITTVDLNGISRIEQVFAVVLAGAAMALFVALSLAERRHEFAAMTAVGASLRDVGAFLWTEAAIVLVASLILGGALGWLLSLMLVAMLQHVFDPPPDALSVPWAYLAELALGSILSATVAVLLTVRALGRMQLGAILREQ